MFIPDPESWFLPIPDPGSRGQKGTGSRIGICNTDDRYKFSNGTFSRCWTKIIYSGTIKYLKSKVWILEARVSPWVPLVWCHWSACPGYNSPIEQQQLLLAQEMHSDLFPGIEYLPTLSPLTATHPQNTFQKSKNIYFYLLPYLTAQNSFWKFAT